MTSPSSMGEAPEDGAREPEVGSDSVPALKPASDQALRIWRATASEDFLVVEDICHMTKYFDVPAKFATTSDGTELRFIRKTLPAITASAIARAV